MTQDPKRDSNFETQLKQIVDISRRYGADPRLVIAGGGNTSVKTETTLYVKASGHALATIGVDGFTEMDRPQLQEILDSDLGDEPLQREEKFKAAIFAARRHPEKGQRPSVECLLHDLIDGAFVIHSHSTVANALTCCSRGEELADELFGDEVLWIGYVDPGYPLARATRMAIEAYEKRTGRKRPTAILMQNHGLIVSGDSPEEVCRKTDAVVEKIQQHLAASDDVNAFGAITQLDAKESPALIDVIAPALRGLLAEGGGLKTAIFNDSHDAVSLACGATGPEAANLGGLMPDQIAYCGSFPLWISPSHGETAAQTVECLREAINAYKTEHGRLPRIVLAKGQGLFAAGDDFGSAKTVCDLYVDAIKVMAGATHLGGIHAMESECRRFIENWEVEAYRKSVTAAVSAHGGRLAGKIAIVTGAAQGFGLEIATHLAAEGACVALADLNEAGVMAAAEKLCEAHGPGRAIGLVMNVTSGESLQAAIHQVVCAYGGFDILISNAGVLKADSVKTQPEKDFDFVTAVNYKGYFVCVQHAAPILALQHQAQPNYTSDIIQINSKSGLAGSNRNGAYAGSKFGGIGLTQSFALELVEDGIKVNSICPGNFLDGPLWSDPHSGLFVQYLRTNKVPGAKTVEDVRRAYEAKVPMRRGCRTEDVMTAVYYIVEQQYETGQAVPVTGGQVMLS